MPVERRTRARSSVARVKDAGARDVRVQCFSGVAYGVASMMAAEPFEASTFLLMASTLFLVQLFFLALGALFSVTIPRIKSVVAVSLPTVFTFYIVGMLGDVLANDEVRFITPFKFFETSDIIAQMIQAQPA